MVILIESFKLLGLQLVYQHCMYRVSLGDVATHSTNSGSLVNIPSNTVIAILLMLPIGSIMLWRITSVRVAMMHM